MTVEELVEWVAKEFGADYYDNRDWADYDSESKCMFRELAIKILSHPDLALIDRKESEERCSVCCGGGKMTSAPWHTCIKCDGSGKEIRIGKVIIPLAEALKDK